MKKLLIFSFLLINLIILFNHQIYAGVWQVNNEDSQRTEMSNTYVVSSEYSTQLETWKSQGLRSDIDFSTTIKPLDFLSISDGYLIGDNQGYDTYINSDITNQVLTFDELAEDPSFSFNIHVDDTGLYTLKFDYYSLTNTINPINMEVIIDDEFQYYELNQIVINTVWTTPTYFFADRYGNDIMPQATQSHQWLTTYLQDAARIQPDPLLIKLDAGDHTATIRLTQGLAMIGQIYIGPQVTYIDYNEYINMHPDVQNQEPSLISMEAENPTLKNSISIRYGTNKEPSVSPFGLTGSKLNIIDGSNYDTSGQTLYYDVNVETTGWYQITLKALMTKTNASVFRALTIDGETPFVEALTIPFDYSSKWQNVTLSSADGEKLSFYLEAGTHQISLKANASPFLEIYQNIDYVMKAINSLAIDIKKLTGNNIDEDREWDIVTYIPSLQSDLAQYAEILENSYQMWQTLNHTSKSSEVAAGLKIAYEWLYDLSATPNDVPKNLDKLATGSNSIMQTLGVILPLSIESPLSIDMIYIHTVDADLPNARANFFVRLWIGIKRFVLSFFNQDQSQTDGEETIEIWVNRSRQYVNLMQQMVDAEFTPETGIKVNISIMSSEDKLILSTSSGANPDIAMGISGWRPYDFAIRGAAYDISQFDDFRTISERFYPGAFTQLIYQEGVYALPETQNFYFLFYRTDIINALNFGVPDTWQEVIDVLPEIQRFGMNFYSQLSGTNSFKGFVSTMPYIYQFGGVTYSEDVLSSALDDPKTIDAITFMTNLYNIYSLPLEVGSFFNEFRYGNIPMGIGDFGMYIQLLNAAPEIAGLWDIALLPGVENEEGIVDRTFDGSSTSAMIFNNSDYPEESWEFLKWWTSTETQIAYSNNLINAMGSEYMWNTSNYEAFQQLSWQKDHQDVFMEQWQWIFDTAKTPASYMLEREISNIWNKVVYDGENVRTAIEDSSIIIDKEITRKMIEFGYINKKGEVLKNYLLPTKQTLVYWVGEQND